MKSIQTSILSRKKISKLKMLENSIAFNHDGDRQLHAHDHEPILHP